mmetsp:Transcript_45726/g.97216  ORF Transcript_45726/g.97216 Transcript_45726/m.97216 type:complete len:293 (-) Transcript_45726:210-1088(-)
MHVLLLLFGIRVGVELPPSLLLLLLHSAHFAAAHVARRLRLQREARRRPVRPVPPRSLPPRALGRVVPVLLGDDPVVIPLRVRIQAERHRERSPRGPGHPLLVGIQQHDGLDEHPPDGSRHVLRVELAEVGDVVVPVRVSPASLLALPPPGGAGIHLHQDESVTPATSRRSPLAVGPEGHLDLHHGFVAVVHEVADLAGVDADDPQEEVAGDTEGEGHRRVDDGVDRLGDVRGEDLGAAELLVSPVSGEPNLAEGTLLREDDLRVKHGICILGILGGVVLVLLLNVDQLVFV